MKFKTEIPNKYDFMRSNTILFLENEKANTEITHEKNVGKLHNYGDRRLHTGKEIQNNIEFWKGHVLDFIQNEKIFTEITNENNIGKLYKLNILLEDDGGNFREPPVPKDHTSVVAVSSSNKEYSNMDADLNSRTIGKADAQPLEEKSETSILTQSRLDYSGSSPKRYTTRCFIKPAAVPVWYTESLTIKLNSTKKTYEQKVYFKVKMNPFQWSETMTTEVKTLPKLHYNETHVPVEKSDIHYMSLEPQQVTVL